MGKTRDLFKKIRDTKGTFNAKMGTIKDRNDMDLIEAEDIKKNWQEYTEKLYKKDLHYLDNHDGVIILIEPDILEGKVKWNSGSITTNKASGGDGIPVGWAISNPKIWHCENAALSMPANLENSAVATGLKKVSFIPIPKKGNAQEHSNYCTIALISHTSKLMFKILQARLQLYVNHELLHVQAGFRNGRGTRYQITNICWIIE